MNPSKTNAIEPVATPAEREKRAKLDASMRRHWGAMKLHFVEWGKELAVVRAEKLWRITHDSFDHYTHEEWGMGERNAGHLIDAAEVGTLVPISNVGQARALAPLKNDPVQIREVFEEAEARAGGVSPSATTLKEIIVRRREDANEHLRELWRPEQLKLFEENRYLALPSGEKEARDPQRERERRVRDYKRIGSVAAQFINGWLGTEYGLAVPVRSCRELRKEVKNEPEKGRLRRLETALGEVGQIATELSEGDVGADPASGRKSPTRKRQIGPSRSPGDPD
jgi:hypothetical protein